MLDGRKMIENRVENISTRAERQTRWLGRLREKAEELKAEFAKAVKINDPVMIEKASEAFTNKCKFIAHVELTILQHSLEKDRLVRSLYATQY